MTATHLIALCQFWQILCYLSKSLKAFNKSGTIGAVELKFCTGIDGKIDSRHPFRIENKQRRYDYNGIEKAIIAPLNPEYAGSE